VGRAVVLEEAPWQSDAALAEATIVQTLRDLIVCKISDNEFGKLRITRAYIKLLCIPEGADKVVSLARIGNYEVRMFETSQSGADAAALFLMELFDQDAQLPVDSCVCYDIGKAVTVYQDFISR
jgi:hypothetical protein